MQFDDVLTNQPVVIDNGSGIIKAGFAGDDYPKAYFPSCVGRPKHLRIMAGAVEGSTFIGPKLNELKGLLKLKYPMEHGIVTNWEDMERIWEYLYTDELKTLSEEHPVLLTEAPFNPRKHRDQAAQIFFETFNVPALFLSIQAVLALYASGRTTGLVLDSGDGVTHSVPVYQGFAIPHAIRRMDCAGRDITTYLQLLLRKSGYSFHTSAEFETVKNIKESLCYVSLNPSKEEKEISTGFMHTRPYEEYILPDQRILKLGSERFKAPEVLFQPDLIGLEYPGIHQLLVESVLKTDLDLRPSFYSNIILSGGSTLYKCLGERLLNEIKLSISSKEHKDTKIKIYAPQERKYATWMGGSILASLSTFKKMWISAEEYQEDPDIIHKRSFS